MLKNGRFRNGVEFDQCFDTSLQQLCGEQIMEQILPSQGWFLRIPDVSHLHRGRRQLLCRVFDCFLLNVTRPVPCAAWTEKLRDLLNTATRIWMRQPSIVPVPTRKILCMISALVGMLEYRTVALQSKAGRVNICAMFRAFLPHQLEILIQKGTLDIEIIFDYVVECLKLQSLCIFGMPQRNQSALYLLASCQNAYIGCARCQRQTRTNHCGPFLRWCEHVRLVRKIGDYDVIDILFCSVGRRRTTCHAFSL